MRPRRRYVLGVEPEDVGSRRSCTSTRGESQRPSARCVGAIAVVGGRAAVGADLLRTGGTGRRPRCASPPPAAHRQLQSCLAPSEHRPHLFRPHLRTISPSTPAVPSRGCGARTDSEIRGVVRRSTSRPPLATSSAKNATCRTLLAGGRLMVRRPAESTQARHRELRSDSRARSDRRSCSAGRCSATSSRSDGTPVRDRQERLSRLFEQPAPRAPSTRRHASSRESARYNIGAVERTLNTPVLTLLFLQADQQPRFQFAREHANARFLGPCGRHRLS